jgi:hypothetical protein
MTNAAEKHMAESNGAQELVAAFFKDSRVADAA